MRGRPPRSQPATAYDYRRTIVLAQVLARADSERGVEALCSLWDVPRGADMLATVRKLAQHALEQTHE